MTSGVPGGARFEVLAPPKSHSSTKMNVTPPTMYVANLFKLLLWCSGSDLAGVYTAGFELFLGYGNWVPGILKVEAPRRACPGR